MVSLPGPYVIAIVHSHDVVPLSVAGGIRRKFASERAERSELRARQRGSSRSTRVAHSTQTPMLRVLVASPSRCSVARTFSFYRRQTQLHATSGLLILLLCSSRQTNQHRVRLRVARCQRPSGLDPRSVRSTAEKTSVAQMTRRLRQRLRRN